MTEQHTVSPTEAVDIEATTRDDLIDGLRALADFYEQRPDAVETENLYGTAMEFFGNVADMVARAVELGGAWRPDDPVRGTYFNLTRVGFPAGFSYQLYCSASLIGEHVDTTRVVPAREWVPSAEAEEALKGILIEARA